MTRRSDARAALARNFLIIFTATLALALVMNLVIIQNSDAALQAVLGSSNRQALGRIRDMVDTLTAENERMTLFLAADEDVNSLARTDSFRFDTFEKVQRVIRTMTTMELLTGTNASIDSIYVYFQNNGFLCVSDVGVMQAAQYADMSWLGLTAGLTDANARTVIRMTLPGPTRTNRAEQPPYLLSTFATLRNAFRGFGAVMINVDIQALGALYAKSLPDDNVLKLYIADSGNRVLYAQDGEGAGQALESLFSLDLSQAFEEGGLRCTIDGRRCVVSAVASTRSEMRFFTVSDLDGILRQSRVVRNYAIGVTAAGAALLLLLSLALAYRFNRPIKEILSVLDAPKDWIRREKKMRLSPVEQACDKILLNISRNEALEKELTDRMLSLRQAQEIALKSQLNPHFLYNTLDAVNWMTRQLTGCENPASEMITLLSDVLRASLESPDKLVTLRREVELAGKYIRINQIRKPNRCAIVWKIAPEQMDLYVGQMTLQPLLENAWLHGFRDAADNRVIEVAGETRDNLLMLSVSDNGCGIDTERLAEIRRGIADEAMPADQHIGLRNVHRRIQLMFGKAYGLSIESEYGQGTMVRLVMPLIREMAADA